MIEVCLAEWGMAPEVVLSGWSWRKLLYMWERLLRRREREARALAGEYEPGVDRVSGDEFLEFAGW